MRSIRAFDVLGKRRFMHWQLGQHRFPVRRLDEERWRTTVERLLVDALAHGGEAGVREELAPPRPELGARA